MNVVFADKMLNSEYIFHDKELLFKTPRTYPAPSYDTQDVKAVFYEGPKWEGRQTRGFARYGLPIIEKNAKVPAVVLVHGKRGTAYAEWIRQWNKRGYAAVAMDWNGALPEGEYPKMPRHEHSGPPPFGFNQVEKSIQDQWAYHAAANIVLSNSLLGSLAEVDSERIGLIGISWGAHLASIAAAVDERFKCAALIYGCGFIESDFQCIPGPEEEEIKKACLKKWFKLWDPRYYLERVKIPMLWLTGANDPYYPLESFRKSYTLADGEHTLVIKVGLQHGHEFAREQKEVFAFFDSLLKDGLPLAKITAQDCDNRKAWAAYRSQSPVVRAELNYTKDAGRWPVRRWVTEKASLDKERCRVTAIVPEGATAYYFNLIDAGDLCVSTEHVIMGGVPKAKYVNR